MRPVGGAPMTPVAGAGQPSDMTVPAPRTIAFAVRAPLTRADLPGLCDRVCALLAEGEVDVAFCDVRGVAADAVALDALARLQLAARRRGCLVRLRHASDELRGLLALAGLRDVLPE